MLVLNHITPTYEGGQGHINGNIQDPTLLGQPRRINNPVFEPDTAGIKVQSNGHKPCRRMEIFPYGTPIVNPLVKTIQQPSNLIERNEILKLIHEVYGPLTWGVSTSVY